MGCDGDEYGFAGVHVVASAGFGDLVGVSGVEFEDEVGPCFHVFTECLGEVVRLDVEAAGGDTARVFGWLVAFGGVFDDCLHVGEFDVVEAGCGVFPDGRCLGLVGEESEWVTLRCHMSSHLLDSLGC